ncbi:MAG: hypothetical protein K8R40_10105, partial [Anaerolineaceae bacterium]|nr:hypothetical protein [Anaerolineaceae bacterium]
TVLSDFHGTTILVTHDRYLVDALASQIWEVRPKEKELLVFEGSYSEFKSWLAAKNALEAENLKVNEKKRDDTVGKRAVSREDRKRKKKQYNIEIKIAENEASLEDISQKLENPPNNLDKLHELTTEYGRLQKELDRLFNDWSQLAE